MRLDSIHMDDLSLENEGEVFEEVVGQNIALLNEFYKKYFKYLRKIQHDNYTGIRDHVVLSNSDLPSSISEHFIYYENGPWFWTFTHPAKEYLFKIYNIHQKRLTANNPQKLIFDFYNKWVFSLENKDSKYFGLSIIKQIKNARKNALNLILHGTILAFDQDLYNPTEAISLFEDAENALMSKDLDELESMELRYIIKLFKGFVYLKIREYENAKQYFEEALQYKEEGITAFFHLALVNIHLDNVEASQNYARQVYAFDLETMTYAIRCNSLPLFELFLENSACSHFFRDKSTHSLLPVFEQNIHDLVSSGQVRFDKLKEDILLLKENKWYKEKGELIDESIKFIDSFIKQFGKSENIFILEAISKLEAKFIESINLVLKAIDDGFQEKINKQLRVYDVKLIEDEDIKKRLLIDLEKTKIKLEQKRELTVQNFNYTMDEKLRLAEERMKNMELSSELNPVNSFKNSMMYCFMLSVLVLVLGGFAEYSNSYTNEMTGFGRLLSVVIIGGSKWGMLTFVVGMFISVFMSVSTSLEKTRIKQRLTKDISTLKDEKVRGTKKINEESKATAKNLEERTTKRIESLNHQIEELKKKKIADQEMLHSNYSSKLKAETQKLTELLEHY